MELTNFRRRISNQKFDCLEYLKLINYSGIINPPFTSLTYNSSVLERTLPKLFLQILNYFLIVPFRPPGHRQFCLYNFLCYDWSRKTRKKLIWPSLDWDDTLFFRGDHVVMQRRWQNRIQNAEKQNLKLIWSKITFIAT